MTQQPEVCRTARAAALDDAVTDMRATARWTIAASSAVGALLLGGAPIVAIGHLKGVLHIAFAYVGLAIAIAGVGWAIWQTSEALIPRIHTIAQLQDPDVAELRDFIAKDPSAFYGEFGQNPQDLRNAYIINDKAAARLAVMAAREQGEKMARILEHAYSDARANADLAYDLEGELTAFVHGWKVLAAVKRARTHTIVAAVVVVLGTFVFLVSSSGVSPTTSPSPAPTVKTTNVITNRL